MRNHDGRWSDLCCVQNRLEMDRCISRQETAARPVIRLPVDDTPSPWDKFDIGASSSFTSRRRSTSPAASTFALSPLSSPSSSYHGDDLASPDPPDDTGCNPVETLSSLHINDTLRSRRSLGSNASSNKSSSSSSNCSSVPSASSLPQRLPSFHLPLRFVSRPPDLPFTSVPTQSTLPFKKDSQSASSTTPRSVGIRRRNRRNPSLAVEDADKIAFEQLIAQRRVHKSFMFSKKNSSCRQTISNILTIPGMHRGGAQDDDDNNDDPFSPRIPPVDYAQTVSARSAHGWQVAARLKAIAPALQRQDGRGKEPPSRDGQQSPPPRDGKESPVDVEMNSKPPSRESSFRSDEAQSAAEEPDTTRAPDSTSSTQRPAAAKAEHSTGGGVAGGGGGEMSVNHVCAPAAGAPAAAAGAAVSENSVDSKKRVYGCTVPGCGKVYTKSSHLKSHQRSHTGTSNRLFTLCRRHFLCQRQTSPTLL